MTEVPIETIDQINKGIRNAIANIHENMNSFSVNEYQIALLILLQTVNELQQSNLDRENRHLFVEQIKTYEASKK